jgi:deoxyribose-phosphate aldolase
VVIEIVAVVAGGGETQWSPTQQVVKKCPMHETVVAIALEESSLLASALLRAAKVTRDVDALFLEETTI